MKELNYRKPKLKKITLVKKIRAFFHDRDRRAASYTEMMPIAKNGLNKAIQAMVTMGELEEVECLPVVCLKWTQLS